LFKPSRLQT